MTQDERISHIEAGRVLQNDGTTYFKLLGAYYTTNLRRKRMYSMDSPTWSLTSHGLAWKLYTAFCNAKRLTKGYKNEKGFYTN